MPFRFNLFLSFHIQELKPYQMGNISIREFLLNLNQLPDTLTKASTGSNLVLTFEHLVNPEALVLLLTLGLDPFDSC